MPAPAVSHGIPEGVDVPNQPDGLRGEAIMARAGGENFPVALRFLPPAHRRDLLAIYGYARLTDELGDSYRGDRWAALDRLGQLVDSAWADAADQPGGRASARPDEASVRSSTGPDGPGADEQATWAELVTRVVAMLHRHGGDPAPLHDLIAANRQDQQVGDYTTFEQLVAYCRLSANPVGRLVLVAFDADNPKRRAWSDDVCTGLQLAEHWQDVAEDARAGRVYLPAEDREHFGVTAGMLRSRCAGPELRGLLIFETARARRLLEAGSPLVADLRGWAKVAVAGFVAGGLAAADALASVDFDVLGHPSPRPTKARTLRHAARLLAVRSPETTGAAARPAVAPATGTDATGETPP